METFILHTSTSSNEPKARNDRTQEYLCTEEAHIYFAVLF